MRTTSYTELRKNLSATMDGIAADHEPVLITRGGGKPPAVMMSLEDFAAYEETRHLLRSPENAARLLKATQALDTGHGAERTLNE